MKNEKESSAVKTRPKWVYILIAVAVVLVIDVVLFAALKNRDSVPADQSGSVGSPEAAVSLAESAQPEAATEVESAQQETEALSIVLDRGLEITKIGAYTGAYVEDGSDEVVSGVMMLVVTNSGEDCIQYGEITLAAGEQTALFTLSTLMPGETVVLLEQNRMEYLEGVQYTAEAQNVAVFPEAPTLCADQIEIQALDGALNVTNISGGDIPGDVAIYYKNYAGNMYYGGITYRVRIEGGMAAGEIRQIMSQHFSDTGSKVVFVTVG